MISLSDGVKLPLNFVTSKCAILSMQGRGKTHIAKVMAEEMLEQDQQIIVADPTGVWWGLTSMANGKAEAYNVLVLGGDHGEVPLLPHAGAEIADVVVAERISVVLDMSNFESDAQKVRFMTAFCDRLYRKNRRPVHLFLDEADEFIPQNPNADETRMLHVVKRIWQRGRVKGIGGTIISQRSAVVHKTVLSQSSTLIALQTVGPQDRKALQAWFDAWGTEEQGAQFRDSIAGLPRHEAWVWSPEFDVFARTKARKLVSFDSSATPDVKHGRIREPEKRAAIGRERLAAIMSKAVEEAEANDVDKLRESMAKHRREAERLRATVAVLEQKNAEIANAAPVVDPESVFAMKRHVIAAARDANAIAEASRGLVESLTALSGLVAALGKPNASVGKANASAPRAVRSESAPPARPYDSPQERSRPAADQTSGDGGERRTLVALAQHGGASGTLQRSRLRALAGIPKESSFRTYLSRFKRDGLVEVSGDDVILTREGRVALGDFKPLPVGRALADYWLNHFGGGGESAVLREMFKRPDLAWLPEELQRMCGIDKESSFRTYVSRLVTRGLVMRSNGSIELESGLKSAVG